MASSTYTYRATGQGTMASGAPTPTYTAYSAGVAVATVTRWVTMPGSNAWGATTPTGATGAGATRNAAVAAALALPATPAPKQAPIAAASKPRKPTVTAPVPAPAPVPQAPAVASTATPVYTWQPTGTGGYWAVVGGATVGAVWGAKGAWQAHVRHTNTYGTGTSRHGAMASAMGPQGTPAPNTAPTAAPAPAPVLCTWPSGLHHMRGGQCTRCGHVATAVAAPVRAPQHTPAPTTPARPPQGRSGPRTALLWAVWVLAALCTVLALVLRAPAAMYGKAAQLATHASVALRTYARTL